MHTSAPMLTHTDEPYLDGTCDICHTQGPVRLLHRIVSENFTDWDTLPRGTRYACDTCCWGYLTPDLRTKCYLINKNDSTILPLTKAETRPHLITALPAHIALTVPLSGRKHLLPQAQWGYLSSDNGTILWDKEAAELMLDFCILREAGVTDEHLTGHTLPPRTVLTASGVYTAWERIKPWKSSPYYDVVSRVSRLWNGTETEQEENTS